MGNKILNFVLASAVAIAGLFPFSSNAGTGSGTVKQIIVEYMSGANIAFIYVTQNSGQLSCNTTLRYSFDLTTPAGPSMYSTALSAFALGKSVSIQGNGTCNLWGDSETGLSITAK